MTLNLKLASVIKWERDSESGAGLNVIVFDDACVVVSSELDVLA